MKNSQLDIVLGSPSSESAGQWIEASAILERDDAFRFRAHMCKTDEAGDYSQFRVELSVDEPLTAELVLSLLATVALPPFTPSMGGLTISKSGNSLIVAREAVRLLEPQIRTSVDPSAIPMAIRDKLDKMLTQLAKQRRLHELYLSSSITHQIESVRSLSFPSASTKNPSNDRSEDTLRPFHAHRNRLARAIISGDLSHRSTREPQLASRHNRRREWRENLFQNPKNNARAPQTRERSRLSYYSDMSSVRYPGPNCPDWWLGPKRGRWSAQVAMRKHQFMYWLKRGSRIDRQAATTSGSPTEICAQLSSRRIRSPSD